MIQNGTDVIAIVSGNVTGNVTFHIHNSSYTVDLVNGSATLVNNLTPGSSIVLVDYNGDYNHAAVSVFPVLLQIFRERSF